MSGVDFWQVIRYLLTLALDGRYDLSIRGTVCQPTQGRRVAVGQPASPDTLGRSTMQRFRS
jgi:hypothetical protein